MFITEDLRRTLPHHFGPVESGAAGPSEPLVKRVLESMYDPDSDDQFVIAKELLEALRHKPLCYHYFLRFVSSFLLSALRPVMCCVILCVGRSLFSVIRR